MTRIGMAVVLALVASPAFAGEPDRRPPAPAPKPAKPLPPMQVTIESHKALSATSLTPAAVAAKIEASYAASVRRCYGEQLARTPGGQGKLVLRFQITARGDVEAVRASSFDRRLDTCVAGQAVAWKFPIPAGQTGAPATAGFEIAFQLRPDASALADEDTAYANMLTGDPGSVPDAGLAGRMRPGADLQAQIDAVRAGGAQIGTGGGGGTRGGRAPGATAGGGPSGKPAPTPSGRASLSNHRANDPSSLGSSAVAAKILSTYMLGIKRCYRQRLVQEPAARGRVTLSLEVGETGRVSRHDARGFDASIDACIEQLVATWRFPLPKDDAGDPTTASFQLDLTLVPD